MHFERQKTESELLIIYTMLLNHGTNLFLSSVPMTELGGGWFRELVWMLRTACFHTVTAISPDISNFIQSWQNLSQSVYTPIIYLLL